MIGENWSVLFYSISFAFYLSERLNRFINIEYPVPRTCHLFLQKQFPCLYLARPEILYCKSPDSSITVDSSITESSTSGFPHPTITKSIINRITIFFISIIV